MKQTNFSIVLVEDDDVDREAVQRTVRKKGMEPNIHFAREGGAALALLRGETDNTLENNRIVILDINMPGMNGLQFLNELRNDPEHRDTIVFVLSTSLHPNDIARAYELGIAGYFDKSSLDMLIDVIKDYFQAVHFPARTCAVH